MRYYIERCDDGYFLSHRDKFVEEFPDAQLFDSYAEAERVFNKSQAGKNDPSDTAIRSED